MTISLYDWWPGSNCTHSQPRGLLLLTSESSRGLEYSRYFGTTLNMVAVTENPNNFLSHPGWTHRPFEHEWSISWTQLLDLRLDP